MSNDTVARKQIGVTFRTLVNRVLRTFNEATDADLEAGAKWYSEAQNLARDLASMGEGAHYDVTVEQAAAVIAHLSPRTSWTRNVLAATTLVATGNAISGLIGRNFDNALDVLETGYSDPVETFGGPKTRSFYLNILGDTDEVTVDVWAARVVGVDEATLARKGVYEVIQEAYRAAALKVGVAPATMQATTWIIQRGGRAA